MARGLVSGLLALALPLALGCSVPVSANLDESDANNAVLVLEQRGVGADKQSDPEHEGRFRLIVPQGDAAQAIAILAQENLPPRSSPGVLEALGTGGVVPSRLAEHAKWTTGVAGDLERSLRTIDGVLSARVHLAVPPKELLPGEEARQSPSASVLVRHRGSTPPIAEQQVQKLVSGAVAGLAPEHVSVVLATTAATRLDRSERALQRFGPLTVTRGSALPLRWIVGLGVLLNLTLIGGLLFLWARLRRSELALTEAKADPTPPDRRAR